jgi:hypothetical protein
VADEAEGLTFTEDQRRLFLVLMGQEPPEAVPGKVLSLRAPFDQLDQDLSTLPEHYSDTAAAIDGALPDEAVTQFKSMFASLLGADGGISQVDQIRNAAQLMGEQIQGWYRSLIETQVEMLTALITLEIQLDIMTAMAFFTGGASLGEEAVAEGAARIVIRSALDRLLAFVEFVLPTAIQAAIGALMMMVASLIASGVDGDPNGPHVNWKWVGEGALGGALADAGIRGIGGFFDKLILDGVKGLDKPVLTELTNIGGDALKMGGGTMLSATFTQGIIDGNWRAAPMMFVAGGLVGAGMGAAIRGLGAGALKYRMMKLDPDVIRSLTNHDPLAVTPPGGAEEGSGPRPDPGPGSRTETLTPPPVIRTPELTGPPEGHPPSAPGGTHMPPLGETPLEEPLISPVVENDPLTLYGGRSPIDAGTEPVIRENVPNPLEEPPAEMPPVVDETGTSLVNPPPLSQTPPLPLRPGESPILRPDGTPVEPPEVNPETMTPGVPPGTRGTPLPEPTTPAPSTPQSTAVPPERVPTQSGRDVPPPTEHETPVTLPETTSRDVPPQDETPQDTHGTTSHDTTSHDTPPEQPPAEHAPVPSVEVVSGGHEDVTPNFVLDTADRATLDRLHTGQADQTRRYTGRLGGEDRKFWQQQEADRNVDAAVAAHNVSSTHGVPEEGPNTDPMIRIRAAGVPDGLARPVAEAYRAAVAEHETETRNGPKVTVDGTAEPVRPLADRLIDRLETVLGDHDYGPSPAEVAERLLHKNERFEPEAWARKAGLPEHLISTVADGYRTVRTEQSGLSGEGAKQDPAAFERRLAETLETRFDGAEHEVPIPAVTDRLIREQARVDADRTQPWTQEVQKRFDTRWQQAFDQHQRGEISQREFERRFQGLVDGLPDELEMEAAVRSARASAETALSGSPRPRRRGRGRGSSTRPSPRSAGSPNASA